MIPRLMMGFVWFLPCLFMFYVGLVFIRVFISHCGLMSPDQSKLVIDHVTKHVFLGVAVFVFIGAWRGWLPGTKRTYSEIQKPKENSASNENPRATHENSLDEKVAIEHAFSMQQEPKKSVASWLVEKFGWLIFGLGAATTVLGVLDVMLMWLGHTGLYVLATIFGGGPIESLDSWEVGAGKLLFCGVLLSAIGLSLIVAPHYTSKWRMD